MVIRIWQPCIVLSCIVIPCLFAKPFSLNEAIAAEERQKGLQNTQRSPQLVTETSERFSLNKALKSKLETTKTPERYSFNKALKPDSERRKKHKPSETPERYSLNKVLRLNPAKIVKSKKLEVKENLFKRGKKISPLQYRKTFQIKSPLKPYKLKSFKARHRRRNQSIKREISEDDQINKKYIPLLRSLSMLFDNILAESGDSFETTRAKLRKLRHSKRKKTECTCTDRHDESNANTSPPEETTVPTTSIDEVTTFEPTQPTWTQAATTTTYYASSGDISDLRPDTDVPTILPRDTTSTRRDYTRVSERSSAAFHTSTERNITGNHGNRERDTASGKHKPRPKDNEEDPDGSTREHASSIEFRGRVRGDRPDTRRPVFRGEADETSSEERKSDKSTGKGGGYYDEFERQVNSKGKDSIRHVGRDFIEFERENKFEVRGDETDGSRTVQQFVRGDRRFVSEDSVDDHTEPIQPQEDHEGIVGVAHHIAGDQRLADGDGTAATENQKDGAANTPLISIKDLKNPILMPQNSPKHKSPFVTIIDGYSVARDKNGANKLAEQSIRFHS